MKERKTYDERKVQREKESPFMALVSNNEIITDNRT